MNSSKEAVQNPIHTTTQTKCQADAPQGQKSGLLYVDQLLRLAADDLEQRGSLATTLPRPGAPAKGYFN
jgi:hypothetical protein